MKHTPLFLLLIAAALLAHRAPRTAHPAAAPVGSCTGDLNGDRSVTSADLSALLANFGSVFPAERTQNPDPDEPDPPPSMAAFRRGDLNGDHHIDGQDITILLNTFGCHEWPPEQTAQLHGPPAEVIDDTNEPWSPGGGNGHWATGNGEGIRH